MKNENKEQKRSDLVIDVLMDDKLDSAGITLMSDQNKYIKTLKDQNEEKR